MYKLSRPASFALNDIGKAAAEHYHYAAGANSVDGLDRGATAVSCERMGGSIQRQLAKLSFLLATPVLFPSLSAADELLQPPPSGLTITFEIKQVDRDFAISLSHSVVRTEVDAGISEIEVIAGKDKTRSRLLHYRLLLPMRVEQHPVSLSYSYSNADLAKFLPLKAGSELTLEGTRQVTREPGRRPEIHPITLYFTVEGVTAIKVRAGEFKTLVITRTSSARSNAQSPSQGERARFWYARDLRYYVKAEQSHRRLGATEFKLTSEMTATEIQLR